MRAKSLEDHGKIRYPIASAQCTELWYPDVPSTALSFNGNSLVGKNTLLTSNQPLSWVHFGGKEAGDGSAHLKGILVQYSPYFKGLELIFDHGWEPEYPTKLGRCENLRGGRQEMLLIDGAGGERVETVCVGQRRYKASEARGTPETGCLKKYLGKFNTLTVPEKLWE